MHRMSNAPRITIAEVGREPFRVFFPAGVLAGITGVALWPLHFMGLVEMYPGHWLGTAVGGVLGLPFHLIALPFGASGPPEEKGPEPERRPADPPR